MSGPENVPTEKNLATVNWSKNLDMSKALVILKAQVADLPRICDIYAAARWQMVANLNPTQWTNGYPSQALLEEDIANGQLYKVLDQDEIIGVFGLVPGPDEVYAKINGAWLNAEPYLAIHRIAAWGAGGVTKAVIQWVMHLTDNLRIDTHNDNHAMRYILEGAGFVYVGELTLPDGTARRAYHLIKR